jgi:site-specific DNA-methyltransferase (adenine-specific)
MKQKEYNLFLRMVWARCHQKLKVDGRIAINIGNIGRKPYIHNSGIITHQLKTIGYHMMGEIIWYKAGSAWHSTAWGSYKSASAPVLRDSHEYIVVAAKKHPKRSKKGVSDITSKEFEIFTRGEWTMDTAHASQKDHPAPFPDELAYRLIKLYTYVGDVVLDPFCGSGTAPCIAKQYGRIGLGVDKSPLYCQLARRNLRNSHLGQGIVHLKFQQQAKIKDFLKQSKLVI